MKAIVYSRYGSPDVLSLRDLDVPVVKDDGVLVRIHAASVNPLDWYAMTGTPYVARVSAGLRRPKNERLGADFAGTVEAVGKDVTQFQPGDEVFGASSGTFAEYVCAHEDRMVLKPASLTFAHASTVPVAALTALQGLRDKGQIQPGQKVVINGASGGVGTFAVQIATAFGAEVTGVCSTRNVDMVRSLGADHVIDYTQEDFTRGGQRYDLMLDIAGSRSWSECKRVLAAHATVVIAGGPKSNRLLGPLSHVVGMRLASVRASQKAVFFISQMRQTDLVVLRELLDAGKVAPVVERNYQLSETSEALSYLGEGHAQGKLVIAM